MRADPRLGLSVSWLRHGQGGRRRRNSSTLQYTTCDGPRPGPAREKRGPSHGPGGRRHRSSSSTSHFMGRGPGRPVKTSGPPHRLGEAAHIKPTSHGPRPDPAHQISIRWATARPGPPIFQMMGRGPARPIKFSDDGPRPGLAYQNISKLSAPPGPSHFKKSRPGPARPGS